MPEFLSYGRQLIEEDDIAAVVAALRSERLAHGPLVGAFEAAFAEAVGAGHAVACSSGTAALQLALMAANVGPGDVCVVPAITFLATATAALWLGAEVRFADVDADTGLMTPETLEQALAKEPRRVAAVLPVHLGGRMTDLGAIGAIAAERGARVIEDAAHALGSADREGRAGDNGRSDFACFSLHPVKTIAAGEGGMVTTAGADAAERMRRLANHGVTREAMSDRELSFDADGRPNPWSYEQVELGLNARMDEMSAALGRSQVAKLARFKARRAALAAAYDQALERLAPLVRPVRIGAGQSPCLHLYQVLIDFNAAGMDRATLMRRMSEAGVGTQVHYAPVYRQPYFSARYGEQRLSGAEAFYARVLALPLFPAMEDEDVERVAEVLRTTRL